MSDRNELTQQIVIANQVYTITVFDHPLIEDVVVAEAKIKAESIVSGVDDSSRRVDRSIRNLLIKLGVET